MVMRWQDGLLHMYAALSATLFTTFAGNLSLLLLVRVSALFAMLGRNQDIIGASPRNAQGMVNWVALNYQG
jgi:hypothetical protein